MSWHGSSSLIQTAMIGCLLAVIYVVAPGEPSWMERMDVKELEHPLPSMRVSDKPPFSVQTFLGGDGVTDLVGRLYLPPTSFSVDDVGEPVPNNPRLPPVLVMAHGLGLVQDAKLISFIEAYVHEGIAVMTFDYATFGWSQGWPRHQLIPNRRIADLRAALAHVRKNLKKKVDIERIGLWGNSLGGGHVLSVAAMEPDIKAVVAMVPHVKSGLESLIGTIANDPPVAILGLIKLCGAMLKGLMSHLLDLALPGDGGTTYIPLHGLPGSAAAMQNPGDDEGYGRLVKDLPSSLRWENLMSVSSVLPILFYRPLNVVNKISSPTLLLTTEHDTLCPSAAVEAAAARMDGKLTKVVTFRDASHFLVYDGQLLQRALQESRTFLVNQLVQKGRV